jgi:phospholipid/cholesterol/gamma-HCH transport system substrate-binding protein
MMENKAHALMAGAFVLVVSALLAALAVWLMRDTTQRDMYEISTAEIVSGLQPQAVVRFRGVPVGKVERIGFDNKVKGNVLIRISIDRGAPVTKSVFATVASQGVTGLGFIQLDDNGESSERLVPNDDDPPRIPLKPGSFDKLLKQSEVIFDQLEQASTKLNQVLAEDNQKRLAMALDNMSQAAGSVNSLSTTFTGILNAQLGPDKVNIPKLLKDLDAAVVSLRETSVQTSAAVTEVGNTAKRLNEKGGPLDKLSEGGAALAAGVETFSAATLPKLGEVADETARTMRQLRRTVNAVDDNPQSLIFGNGPPQPGPGEPGFSATGVTK